MQLADTAWNKVSATTIRHCWRNTQILPTIPNPPPPTPSIPASALIHTTDSKQSESTDPVQSTENNMTKALNELTSTGVLQRQNRIDIEELLNPQDKDIEFIMKETSKKLIEVDIHAAVVASRQAQGNVPETGGNNNADDDAVLEDHPSRKAILEATSVISKHLRHADSNNSNAEKMESLLNSLRRQLRIEETRSKVSTTITSFFPRK